MILKLEKFCNEKGFLIEERTLHGDPSRATPFERFMGTVGLPTPDGTIEPMEFPIKATSLEQAFMLFDQTARAAHKKILEEMKAQERKIITPGR